MDHGRNYLDPQGGIYAIAVDDTIMIKRVQADYPTKRIKIISDNSKYSLLEADIRETRESAHCIANVVIKLATNLHKGFHEIFPTLEEPIRRHERRKRKC